MKANIAIGLALVAVVIAILPNLGDRFLGAATSGNTTNFDAVTLDNGDLTITNGDIVVAVPTTGTSTLATVGCLQANATSSATKIKLVFSPLGATSTFSGTAYWSYGTCP